MDDLPFHVLWFGLLVLFERDPRDGIKFRWGQAAVDLQDLQRAIEPLEMFFQFKRLAAKGPRGFKRHVPQDQGGIEDRNLR